MDSLVIAVQGFFVCLLFCELLCMATFVFCFNLVVVVVAAVHVNLVLRDVS